MRRDSHGIRPAPQIRKIEAAPPDLGTLELSMEATTIHAQTCRSCGNVIAPWQPLWREYWLFGSGDGRERRVLFLCVACWESEGDKRS